MMEVEGEVIRLANCDMQVRQEPVKETSSGRLRLIYYLRRPLVGIYARTLHSRTELNLSCSKSCGRTPVALEL